MTIQNTAKSAPVNRSVSGPFDISEVAIRSQYANFGALQILPQQDVDIRLEIEDGDATVRSSAIKGRLTHNYFSCLEATKGPRVQ